MLQKIITVTTTLLCLPFFSKGQDNNYGVKGFYPKTFDVADSSPVSYNGLTAGYTLQEESEKAVGKKGDFSRYKIFFYLRNDGSEAKIMYRNLNFGGHSGPITNNIALFKCLNATGARMTNKMASMELQPCKLEALVEDKKVLADIGFWIKPGETVSKTYPMIVPLREKPKLIITFYPEVTNQTGSIVALDDNTQNSQQEFVRLKNNSTNTYLHNQNGPLACSTIDYNWWSAQWEILPVAGTNNFQIKNRWKNNYLSTDNGNLLSDYGNTANAMWLIEETGVSNTYYIRNVASNSKLVFQNGQLKTSNSYNSNDASSQWVIEK